MLWLICGMRWISLSLGPRSVGRKALEKAQGLFGISATQALRIQLASAALADFRTHRRESAAHWAIYSKRELMTDPEEDLPR